MLQYYHSTTIIVLAKQVKEYANKLWRTIQTSKMYFDCPVGRNEKISRGAAVLLIPYLIWVSVAGYLNYSIWKLNR